MKPALFQETSQVGVIIRQENTNPIIILIETRAGRIISTTTKEFEHKLKNSI